MVKDGWHECHGYDLWVEDGKVIRAAGLERNIYQWCKPYHCWINVTGRRSYSAVREGLRTGRYKIA